MIKPLAHLLFTIFFCVTICLVNVFLLISFKDDIGQEEVTILCILDTQTAGQLRGFATEFNL